MLLAVCVPAYMGREYAAQFWRNSGANLAQLFREATRPLRYYIQYKYKEEKRQRMQILQNMQRDTLAAVRNRVLDTGNEISSGLRKTYQATAAAAAAAATATRAGLSDAANNVSRGGAATAAATRKTAGRIGDGITQAAEKTGAAEQMRDLKKVGGRIGDGIKTAGSATAAAGRTLSRRPSGSSIAGSGTGRSTPGSGALSDRSSAKSDDGTTSGDTTPAASYRGDSSGDSKSLFAAGFFVPKPPKDDASKSPKSPNREEPPKGFFASLFGTSTPAASTPEAKSPNPKPPREQRSSSSPKDSPSQSPQPSRRSRSASASGAGGGGDRPSLALGRNTPSSIAEGSEEGPWSPSSRAAAPSPAAVAAAAAAAAAARAEVEERLASRHSTHVALPGHGAGRASRRQAESAAEREARLEAMEEEARREVAATLAAAGLQIASFLADQKPDPKTRGSDQRGGVSSAAAPRDEDALYESDYPLPGVASSIRTPAQIDAPPSDDDDDEGGGGGAAPAAAPVPPPPAGHVGVFYGIDTLAPEFRQTRMTRRSAAERAGEFDAPAAAEAAAEEDRRAAAVVERNMVTWDEASIGSSRSFRKSAASFRKSKLQSERSHRRLLRELRSQMSMSASRLTKMIADHGKEELAREIITFRELPHQPMYVPPLTSALVNSLYSGVADKKKHHRLYAEAMTASLVVRHGYQPTWDKTVRLGTRLGYSAPRRTRAAPPLTPAPPSLRPGRAPHQLSGAQPISRRQGQARLAVRRVVGALPPHRRRALAREGLPRRAAREAAGQWAAAGAGRRRFAAAAAAVALALRPPVGRVRSAGGDRAAGARALLPPDERPPAEHDGAAAAGAAGVADGAAEPAAGEPREGGAGARLRESVRQYIVCVRLQT